MSDRNAPRTVLRVFLLSGAETAGIPRVFLLSGAESSGNRESFCSREQKVAGIPRVFPLSGAGSQVSERPATSLGEASGVAGYPRGQWPRGIAPEAGRPSRTIYRSILLLKAEYTLGHLCFALPRAQNLPDTLVLSLFLLLPKAEDASGHLKDCAPESAIPLDTRVLSLFLCAECSRKCQKVSESAESAESDVRDRSGCQCACRSLVLWTSF